MQVADMNQGARRHVDGGLINEKRASHVIISVQALLHSHAMVDLILSDSEHRAACRSLLQCLLCSLYKIYKSMEEKGVGDPSPLVNRWNGIARYMTNDEKTSPKQILAVFIDVMRMEYRRRNPKPVEFAYEQTAVGDIWMSSFKVEVSCPSCGHYSTLDHKTSLQLEMVDDLEAAISNELLGNKVEVCKWCRIRNADCKAEEIVCLAECLIVHVEKFLLDFEPPHNVCLMGTDYSLYGVIAGPLFVALCADGLCRKFDDSTVSLMSSSDLAILLQQRRTSMIFEKKRERHLTPNNVQDDHKSTRKTSKKRGSKVFKIMSYPNIAGLQNMQRYAKSTVTNPQPKECDTSTQTEITVQNAEVQTIPYFSYETCKFEKNFKYFTGVCTEDFEVLYNVIGGHAVISTLKLQYKSTTPKKLRPTKLSSRDKLFMFLLRLRRGLPLPELSVMFNISVSTASVICYAMTRLIYLTFKGMELDMFPTAEEQRKKKPLKMKPFKNLRIILDGVSFYTQTPSNFEQQGNTYSSYKSHNVVVFSVGIACNGATIFCSEGMEGSMSDKEVILKSGLLQRLQKGDGVMTDRGYELTAELQAIGCEFYKPPSLGGRNTFTAEEEIMTKAIASARIYSEHAIADIKDNRLLQGVIPMTMLPVLSDLVYIAAYLRNFNECRILNKKLVPKDNTTCDDEDPPGKGRTGNEESMDSLDIEAELEEFF